MFENRTSVGCGATPETLEYKKWAKVTLTKNVRYLGIITLRKDREGYLFNINQDMADYFMETRPWQDFRLPTFLGFPFFLPTKDLKLKVEK